MKTTAVALLVLGVAGCLPAYDNRLPDASVAVMIDASPEEEMAPPGEVGSGKFASGYMFSAETATKHAGPIVEIEGFPAFASAPADANGAFRFEIPKSVADADIPRYLIISGMAMSKPILRTWVAPRKLMMGGTDNTNMTLHFFENEDDKPKIRRLMAKELAMKGDIAAEEDLATKYSLAYGWLLIVSDLGFSGYKNYSIQVTDGKPLDNTNCKPTMQCCVYYFTAPYEIYVNAPPKPNFVDFGSARATSGPFAVVCPTGNEPVGKRVREITLSQTALNEVIYDQFGNPPPKPFSPIEVPLVVGDPVDLQWWIRP